MLDRQTGKLVTVNTEGTAGPYIPIGVAQLDQVTRALNRHGLQYMAHGDATRLDGQPVTAVVNLGEGVDVQEIQRVLDSITDEEPEDQTEQVARLRETATRAIARTAIELVPNVFGIGISLSDIFPKKRDERRKSIVERKTQLVKELTGSGIDPVMFDILLTNEMDRRMKVRFGIVFLVLTIAFTAASYAIVILDAVNNWNIAEVAVTALIIETPIQFIGLLYIIARNLFPTMERGSHQSKKPKVTS